MKDLLSFILNTLKQGTVVMLCSIVRSSGSTPRGVGACMAVTAAGVTCGTVGGGSVEAQCISVSVKNLTGTGLPFVRDFDLSPGGADGLICGGTVSVLFLPLQPVAQVVEFFGLALEASRAERRSWLVCVHNPNAAAVLGLLDENGPGVTLSPWFGGKIPPCIDWQKTRPMAGALVAASAPDRTDGAWYFVTPLNCGQRVWIFGAGHVAQELAPVLARTGFDVLLVDDRPEFANPSLFEAPVRTIAIDNFSNLDRKVSVGPDDFVAVMTRGHQADFEVLSQMMAKSLAYIGCLGSRTKVALTRQRLKDECGFTDEQIATLHAPIGIPIGDETPSEIAVSIAAEMILCRARLLGKKIKA
ncbi:MAG: XdhC family protein [Spirochaetales bacterium]|nr:XdhC family protein [Spirochaetales bacterium]